MTSMPEDFYKYMESFKVSFNETINSSVEAAVAPIRDKQIELTSTVNAVSASVVKLRTDQAATKELVNSLQAEVSSLKSGLAPRPDLSLGNQPNLTYPETSANPVPENPIRNEAIASIRDAKRILGFSPITIDNVLPDGATEPLNIDAASSIRDFLHFEMNIPREIVDKFKILKVFPPANKPTGWDQLYAEFDSPAATDLILQYACYLKAGKQINLYVPQKLQWRFRAVNSLAYSYRKGPQGYKTRFKYGIDDFCLLIKPRSNGSRWSYASLNCLPPFQFTPALPSLLPLTERVQRKRGRSDEQDSRTSRPRTGESTATNIVQDTTLVSSETDSNIELSNTNSGPDATEMSVEQTHHEVPEVTPSDAEGPIVPSRVDMGSFLPSACVSPSTVRNKDFDFVRKSSLPRPLN